MSCKYVVVDPAVVAATDITRNDAGAPITVTLPVCDGPYDDVAQAEAVAAGTDYAVVTIPEQ